MKCPKCQYIGFEESGRCRHCGYDFSLGNAGGPLDAPLLRDEPGEAPGWDTIRQTPAPGSSSALDPLADLAFDAAPATAMAAPSAARSVTPSATPSVIPSVTPAPRAAVSGGTPRVTPDGFRAFVPESAPAPASAGTPVPATDPADDPGADAPLPLFAVGEEDQPLVRLPAVPRRPIAVRRTPETPRLRAVPKPLADVAERDLLFDQDDASEVDDPELAGTAEPGPSRGRGGRRAGHRAVTPAAGTVAGVAVAGAAHGSRPGTEAGHDPVSLVARVAAAAIDHGLLAAIDLAVVYFTLRMAGLTMVDWRMLPLVPFGLFLLLIGFSYFGVFTTFGGQTIGKMLLGIRVVPDPLGVLDYARVLRRTATALVSLLTCGLAYLPAAFGQRRTLHDRVAGTRVVRHRPS